MAPMRMARGRPGLGSSLEWYCGSGYPVASQTSATHCRSHSVRRAATPTSAGSGGSTGRAATDGTASAQVNPMVASTPQRMGSV